VQLLADRLRHRRRGADRHRALVDDDAVAVHGAADLPRRRQDVLDVGRAVLAWRRADGDELDAAVPRRLGGVGREAQPPGGGIADDELRETGLVDRDPALAESRDLLRVDVEADDVVAEVGEARAGDQADVAGADDADLHRCFSSDGLARP
jgi:hypothetical protein